MNVLYYGDNLEVLRNHIASATIDLIYLDPPFNSKRGYNLLFKSPEGESSRAQVTAFEDTWTWGEGAALAFDEVMRSGHAGAATMLNAMRAFLGESDVMAYLSMMAVRLIELHRVLKPTGSIYLHCDPTASHYLKILMDSIFASENLRNEIIWHYRRWPTKSSRFQRMHDVLLFYKGRAQNTFNILYQEPTASSQKRWKGKQQRATFDALGKRLPTLEEDNPSLGVPLDDVWDIPIIAPSSKERLGYPTQKPLALLERIIRASSSKGDLVMDPFCGCGTAVDAAQKLGRRWIGIDITHLAVGLIERRLKKRYPSIVFDIRGIPKDIDGLRAMAAQARSNPRLYYELQYWAINQIPAAQHAQDQKKGADKGIDGMVWLRPSKGSYEKALISVKAGENVGVEMVRSLIATVEREKAKLGILLTLAAPTRNMKGEAAVAGMAELEGVRCPKIQILTFQDLLDGKQPQLPYADYAFALPKAKQDEGEQSQLF